MMVYHFISWCILYNIYIYILIHYDVQEYYILYNNKPHYTRRQVHHHISVWMRLFPSRSRERERERKRDEAFDRSSFSLFLSPILALHHIMNIFAAVRGIVTDACPLFRIIIIIYIHFGAISTIIIAMRSKSVYIICLWCINADTHLILLPIRMIS